MKSSKDTTTSREERFSALDKTREAFKDVPKEELEEETARAIANVRKEHSHIKDNKQGKLKD